MLVRHFPDCEDKIASISANLCSSSRNDWENILVTCRKILELLGNKINPDEKHHAVLNDYVNDDYKDHAKSHMKYISKECGDKGAHTKKEVKSKEEAEKIILHTFLYISEIDWDKVSNSS